MPSLASSTATTNAATAPTSVKMENKTPATAPSSSLDVPESLKAVLTIVEKKVRNLEKRKSRLDGYREEMARGKPLDAEQRLAVARYDEVVQNLELARELTKQFDKIASDTSKEEKKRKKREAFEKQQSELNRFKELLTIKEALSCAVRSDSREHFLNGTQGAILLEEADLAKLQAFGILISLDRPDMLGGFQEAVGSAAQHFQLLLEGRSKEVAGSSYKELKDLLSRVSKCAYFDWKVEAPTTEVIPTNAAPEDHVVQEEPVYEPANGEAPVVVESVPAIAAPIMTPVPAVVPLQAPSSYFPVEMSTDFNFIQDSLIDCQAPIPAPTAAVPVAVPPVSLASMDSAVVMVHAQVPHLPHGHHMAYTYLQGAPAPAPLFHPAAHNPLSGVPQSMMQQPQPPMQQTSEVPVHEAEPLAQEPAQPIQEQPQVEQRTSPAWAEEVDDEQPFQQQPHKNESNTWTNSNYRSNDHEFSGRGRGGYRGRGGGRGGPRGGGPSGGQGNYFNSRGGSGGYGGSSDQRNSYYNSNSGGSQGNNGYRGRGGGGSYGARNNGGGGGYRGNGSSRGAPRGAPRGGYDRNN